MVPWLATAKDGEPGHPLYVSPRQTAGRLDNPDLYRVLYLAASPSAAVAEAFGSFELWTPAMFGELPTLPGSRRALATYEIPTEIPILDLNDAKALVEWSLRPSEVVSRDRGLTQGWARRIFGSGHFAGVRWWSFYNPDWISLGLWDYTLIKVTAVDPLVSGSPAFEEARLTLMRSWVR